MPVIDVDNPRVMTEPNSGCWLWIGSLNNYGYGRRARNRDDMTGAHIVSYQEHVGHVPDGICVLHKCDNRCCVNPEHLFLGTRTDNKEDMVRKNRQHKGEQIVQSILTEEDVRRIRLDARPAKLVAPHYNVSPGTIEKARRRETWRHVV